MKKTISLLIVFALVASCTVLYVSSYNSPQIEKYIEGAFEARRTGDKLGATILGSEKFTNLSTGGSSSASSTWTDWMALAMARYSTVYDDGTIVFNYDDGSGYSDYLKAMKAYVTKTYSENEGKLSNVKATEWHRAILAITALGGDPTNFGTFNGSGINLIADGTYNCLVSRGPSRQGINGVIFALISKNIKGFTQPSEVKYTDEYFITYILQNQLSDGGWALSGNVSDPDVTAMAIQALTPYYSSSTSYTYTNTKLDKSMTKTVKQAVNEALSWLSDVQLDDGDYVSWGTVNLESTAQVMVAVTGLGINPDTDSRFIKKGHTLADGILKYRLSDGGFTHSYQGDSGNPNADLGKYNYMATDQAAYALVAYWRYINHMHSLYDMRADAQVIETTTTATTEVTSSQPETTTSSDNTIEVSDTTTAIFEETSTNEETTTETAYTSEINVPTTYQTVSMTDESVIGDCASEGDNQSEIPQTGAHLNKTVVLICAAASMLGVTAVAVKKKHDD